MFQINLKCNSTESVSLDIGEFDFYCLYLALFFSFIPLGYTILHLITQMLVQLNQPHRPALE